MRGETKDIWVSAEHADGEVKEVTFELLGEARRLAEITGGCPCAMAVGRDVRWMVPVLSSHGAERVYVCEQEYLEGYHPELTSEVVATVIGRGRPLLVLFPGTSLGDDLACRVGFRLETRVLRHCVNFDVRADGLLEFTRPIYGGRFYGTETCDRPPIVATVTPGVIGLEPPDPSRSAVEVPIDAPRPLEGSIRLIEVVRGDPRTLDLTESDIIVAGGRGLGSPEGFELLQALADELGGTVGATRPTVDDKWVPFEKQVGQTGRTVRPKLYVACGISGAVQHLMGMRDSGAILVINNDPDAPIFAVATLGVVGDLHQIVPLLVQRIRERKGTAETGSP